MESSERSTDHVAAELLRDPLRRTLVTALLDAPATISLASLTRAVKRRGGETPGSNGDLQVLLHHSLLPRLAAHGVVQYQERDQIVVTTDTRERISASVDDAERVLEDLP
jgi:hypothetical protein